MTPLRDLVTETTTRSWYTVYGKLGFIEECRVLNAQCRVEDKLGFVEEC